MPKYPKPSTKVVEKFKKAGGYKTIEAFGWDKVNIKELAKKVTLDRKTIYGIKEHYPVDPEKYKYDYEVKFEDSEGWKLVKQKTEGTKLERYLPVMKKAMLSAFHFLGNKEPLGWKLEQIQLVRSKCLELRDPETKDIRATDRTNLNRCFEAMGRFELKQAMLHVAKREPARIEWYIEEKDYVRFIYAIQEVDTLIYFMLGSLGGARHSGITDPKTIPEGINYERQRMTFYEVKVKRKKAYVTKIFPKPLLKLVLLYVADFRIHPKRNFFKWSYTVFNRRLKKVGELLRLPKKTTTHIMKHTFVSLSSFHGMPPDAIEKQTGTEWATVKKYYRAEDERRMEKEILGVQYPIEPWHKFVDRMVQHFEKRYNELIERYPTVDGKRVDILVKPVKKPPKAKKPKRKLTKAQMIALAKSEKTPEKLREWAKNWLKARGIET